MPFWAVLDACVLHPIALADALLWVAHVEIYQPLWSPDILEELRRSVLERLPQANIDRRITAMTEALPVTALDADFLISTTISMAATLVARSAPATAAQLLAALDRYATESGIPGASEDIASRQRTRARVEETLGPEAFAGAWARGAAMSIGEAAALAHDDLGKIEA